MCPTATTLASRAHGAIQLQDLQSGYARLAALQKTSVGTPTPLHRAAAGKRLGHEGGPLGGGRGGDRRGGEDDQGSSGAGSQVAHVSPAVLQNPSVGRSGPPYTGRPPMNVWDTRGTPGR